VAAWVVEVCLDQLLLVVEECQCLGVEWLVFPAVALLLDVVFQDVELLPAVAYLDVVHPSFNLEEDKWVEEDLCRLV